MIRQSASILLFVCEWIVLLASQTSLVSAGTPAPLYVIYVPGVDEDLLRRGGFYDDVNIDAIRTENGDLKSSYRTFERGYRDKLTVAKSSLIGVYPTYPIPNFITLFSGVSPGRHHVVGTHYYPYGYNVSNFDQITAVNGPSLRQAIHNYVSQRVSLFWWGTGAVGSRFTFDVLEATTKRTRQLGDYLAQGSNSSFYLTNRKFDLTVLYDTAILEYAMDGRLTSAAERIFCANLRRSMVRALRFGAIPVILSPMGLVPVTDEDYLVLMSDFPSALYDQFDSDKSTAGKSFLIQNPWRSSVYVYVKDEYRHKSRNNMNELKELFKSTTNGEYSKRYNVYDQEDMRRILHFASTDKDFFGLPDILIQMKPSWRMVLLSDNANMADFHKATHTIGYEPNDAPGLLMIGRPPSCTVDRGDAPGVNVQGDYTSFDLTVEKSGYVNVTSEKKLNLRDARQLNISSFGETRKLVKALPLSEDGRVDIFDVSAAIRARFLPETADRLPSTASGNVLAALTSRIKCYWRKGSSKDDMYDAQMYSSGGSHERKASSVITTVNLEASRQSGDGLRAQLITIIFLLISSFSLYMLNPVHTQTHTLS